MEPGALRCCFACPARSALSAAVLTQIEIVFGWVKHQLKMNPEAQDEARVAQVCIDTLASVPASHLRAWFRKCGWV